MSLRDAIARRQVTEAPAPLSAPRTPSMNQVGSHASAQRHTAQAPDRADAPAPQVETLSYADVSLRTLRA